MNWFSDIRELAIDYFETISAKIITQMRRNIISRHDIKKRPRRLVYIYRGTGLTNKK